MVDTRVDAKLTAIQPGFQKTVENTWVRNIKPFWCFIF